MNSTDEKNHKNYINGKIYQVINNVNDKIYVGSTCQILCKRMGMHRHYAAAHEGKLYDEMRRLGKTHFYINLIENYPCKDKEELVAKQQFYIRERGTLNNNATTYATEQADVKLEILQLKVMVHEMHTKITQIEDKIDTLLNTLYSSGLSTPSLEDEQEQEQEQEQSETETNSNLYKQQETETNSNLYKQRETETNSNLYKQQETETNGNTYSQQETETNGNTYIQQETETNGSTHKQQETETNNHAERAEAITTDRYKPKPLTPSSPEMFNIADTDDTQEGKPEIFHIPDTDDVEET
jgi:hypothetical protein